MAPFLLALVMAVAPFTAFASTVTQDVTVDASSVIGAFKNLQGKSYSTVKGADLKLMYAGTNNGNTGRPAILSRNAI